MCDDLRLIRWTKKKKTKKIFSSKYIMLSNENCKLDAYVANGIPAEWIMNICVFVIVIIR